MTIRLAIAVVLSSFEGSARLIRRQGQQLKNQADNDGPQVIENIGGGKRIRTADPLLAKQVLCQLSYTPTCGSSNDLTPSLLWLKKTHG
jgi:hypothetical protein